MDVFQLPGRLIEDYSDYIRSFIRIRDERVRNEVEKSLSSGELWPEPLMQLNPSFAHGGTIDELVDQGLLHEECRRIFRAKKDELPGRGPDSAPQPHPALIGAAPKSRKVIAKTLLDYLRRELAIMVDYLDSSVQERIQQQSSQRLISPWALDENELMERAAVAYPRSRGPTVYGGNLFISPRDGFGQYLRRSVSLPNFTDRLLIVPPEAVKEC